MPARQADAPLVDTHFHIYENSMPLASTAWYKKATNAPLDQLIRLFDENGIVLERWRRPACMAPSMITCARR